VLDLMIGIDGVQRRTRQTFNRNNQQARKRPTATVRTTVAATLRALADRIEPVGAAATLAAMPAFRRGAGC
jgi:hypothetical protein